MPHIHEKIDYTVEVFVVYKDKVLLRLHEKYKIWLSVGGHIELDEEPNQAALREVKEEVGLDVKLADSLRPFIQTDNNYQELIPPKFMNMNRISDTHRHVTMSYFATSITDKIIPESPTDQWKWCTETDLEIMDIRPSIKFYAKEALRELGVR